jgi:hypothetical protein
MSHRAIDRVVLVARELDAAIQQLTTVLGVPFVPLDYDEADGCRIAFAADQSVEVIEAVLAPSAPPHIRAWAESLGAHDLAIAEVCFRVDDLDEVRRRLAAGGVAITAELAFDSAEPLPMYDVRELLLDVHATGVPIGLVQYSDRPSVQGVS